MGMAASQARFLGLTARKTNTEYEGQQVNQQRTALANQSAGLYNQMMALNVPTPPSATDYYNMRYTYTGNDGQSYEIMSYTASSGTDGAYDVTVRSSDDVVTYPAVTFNPDGTGDNDIKVNSAQINRKDSTNSYYMTYGSVATQYALTKSTSTNANICNGSEYYVLSRAGVTYYVPASTVETATEAIPISGEFSGQMKSTSSKVTDTTYMGVDFTSDSTGKFEYITLPDGTTKALEIENVTDDTGYDVAMNDYNYKKMVYEKTIQDINAKTEVIQQQDRTLELRLKQLDTEQEALTQEMDAIKKVIDKNVETTFKTFA